MTNPAESVATFYRAFPGFRDATFMVNFLDLGGNSALLVGAFMSFFHHRHGRTVVRTTSWIMIGVIVLAEALIGNLVVRSSTWESLDAPAKGAYLIGGFVGGVVWAFVQWGLILFLFRNRPPKEQDRGPA
jgi:hypothetical protein